jgi:hypothetical protein
MRAEGLRHAGLRNPSVFSLIANPDESLQALKVLRRTLEISTLQSLHFDHTDCSLLDLCASVVQDVLVIRGRRQASFRRGGLRIYGDLPENPQARLLLYSTGIMKQLGLSKINDIPPEIRERLRFSELRAGSPSPPNITSDSELAASALADFFDECLRIEDHQLKPALKGNLIDLITEVLDNAEQHGQGDKLWYSIGYYNTHEKPEDGGECHIVLFNFGDTIFESLNRPDTSEELRRQISDLAAEHERRGYFTATIDQGRAEWSWVPLWQEESLWTLYALQEGVSRFSNKPEGIDRGNGTIKMIEFFTELASGMPQMALLSGRTHILFDGKYRLQPKKVGDEERKVIAFNASNDLRERPDEKYVRTLRNKFPGTLLSLRFHLRRSDLSAIKGKVDAK